MLGAKSACRFVKDPDRSESTETIVVEGALERLAALSFCDMQLQIAPKI